MTRPREEFERFLAGNDFPYQRVPLPYGLATPGRDRSDVLDQVLPPSLAGKSVLDVGCALGYFAFEAEKRGAARVVGVDVRESRLTIANGLRDLLGSRVEFRNKDVCGEPFDETFDVVLFLNVIHHLREPFSALRRLARVARETLVVEFPTLTDPKFRDSERIRGAKRLDGLPLVAVNLTAATKDQTFVFSREAIRRVLLDHDRLFARVEFEDSPTAGRAIARCHRE